MHLSLVRRTVRFSRHIKLFTSPRILHTARQLPPSYLAATKNFSILHKPEMKFTSLTLYSEGLHTLPIF